MRSTETSIAPEKHCDAYDEGLEGMDIIKLTFVGRTDHCPLLYWKLAADPSLSTGTAHVAGHFVLIL